jgi:hypothetical protein
VIRRSIFDPRTIGGLALWLDASDQPSAGAWLDKSGNARNASQLATNNQPELALDIQGGRPGIFFDGINDSLSIPVVSLSAWHAFAVVNPAIASQRTVIHLTAGTTSIFTLSASTTGVQVATASGNATTVSAQYGADTRIGASWDGGALKKFFSGYINEILVYSAALASDPATQVTRYLNGKWGL